ncbi:hypothetical protein AGMMS49579_03940 [Spirochaetia bacterium]|nr:hypothetical protein AGMMS49579_03940 [Spirochaetia bacterium]
MKIVNLQPNLPSKKSIKAHKVYYYKSNTLSCTASSRVQSSNGPKNIASIYIFRSVNAVQYYVKSSRLHISAHFPSIRFIIKA